MEPRARKLNKAQRKWIASAAKKRRLEDGVVTTEPDADKPGPGPGPGPALSRGPGRSAGTSAWPPATVTILFCEFLPNRLLVPRKVHSSALLGLILPKLPFVLL